MISCVSVLAIICLRLLQTTSLHKLYPQVWLLSWHISEMMRLVRMPEGTTKLLVTSAMDDTNRIDAEVLQPDNAATRRRLRQRVS